MEFRAEIDQIQTLIRKGFDRLDALKADLWSAVSTYRDLLPDDLVDEFSPLEQVYAELKSSPISVLIAGVSKAGKSSTANAIIEHDEFFPTGAVRKTDRVSRKEWNRAAIVDTPGIDSIEDTRDERILRKELAKADLVLFLFSDKEGELDRITSEFLRSKILSSKEVLFVLNKKRDD